jgi:hypothetical protein
MTCLCVGSPMMRVRVGCVIWAFTLFAETVSDIVLGLDAFGKGCGLCVKSFSNVC